MNSYKCETWHQKLCTLSSNHSKSGSSYIKLAAFLRKEDSNISCRDLAVNSTLETENQLITKKTRMKTIQRVTYTCSLPYIRVSHCTLAFCVPSWKIHLDLSDQHHTCCTSPRSQANLHSKLHVRHLKL